TPPRKGEGNTPARAAPSQLTGNALFHVPEADDLGHADHAGDVLAPGRVAEELPEDDVRPVVPAVLLQVLGDRLTGLQRRRGRPLVAQLLLQLVGRPAEPGLVAVRR